MVNQGSEAWILCMDLPTNGHRIDIGAISKISEPYTSKMSDVPIMSLPSERRILMDLSVSGTKTLTYTRKCPENPIDDYTVDSEHWSNGFWLFNVQKYLVNRFQMETDGCKLYFKVKAEDGYVSELYPQLNGVNCYISGFGMSYAAGNPFEISGSITLALGSCLGSKEGVYTVTYHSNFSSVCGELSDREASYCQVYTSDGPSVDEYPLAWEQLLRKTMGSSVPQKKGWWWCPYQSVEFSAAYRPDVEESNLAYRWEDEEGTSPSEGWTDLPYFITNIQGAATEIHLYARYSGFTYTPKE